MSLQGQSELREDDVSGGPKLALDALNNLTPSNQAKPYNPLFPPPRPALASDPKPKPSGNDLEADDKSWSMSTISTTLSSLLYGENTGTSSAATSRSNSANFEGIFQQVRTSTPLAISRWSTWTTDFIEQGSSEERYPSINKGAVYTLARETFRVGTYRGYVDTWQSLRDKWQEKIWTMVENPKAVVEQSREPQHSDICKEMSSLEPAVNLTQDLPATPASTQQFMDEAAQRGHPVSATRDEQCLKDVKIFHPDPESAVTISTIAKIDTGSDHSHITPKTLQLLGIPLDSELIQPVDYEYSTLGGPVVARGSITLSWRPFHEPNGHSKHESNTFYISPDNVAYDGLLLGQDILFPLGGPQRVHVCLMNLPIPRTPKQKEDQKKAQEEHKRKVEENERRKKEQLELAAAARQAAGSSSSQIQR